MLVLQTGVISNRLEEELQQWATIIKLPEPKEKPLAKHQGHSIKKAA